VNAADQRTLTPWLGALCVLLAAALLLLLTGVGRGVHWDAPAGGAALPATGSRAAPGVAPPLQHYAEVWQRPLFNVDRRPQPESDGGDADVTLGDLQLTGIILTPDLRMALLRDRNSGREVRVREGSQLPSGGWTLQALKPRSAVFTGNGQRTELPLTVAAHIDGNRGTDDAGKPGTYTPPPPAATPVLRRVAPPSAPRAARPAPRKADATQRPPAGTASSAPAPAAGAAQNARIPALKKSIEHRRRQQAAHDGAKS
jgi:general secretion pathway protein N